MVKTNSWTFKSWIKNFCKVDLPIGDFARDITQDPDFPTDDYITEILEYLNAKLSEDQMLEFLAIWNFYISSNTIPDGRAEILKRLSLKDE